jgi:hypothetical protein
MWLHRNGRMFAERDHVHTLMLHHRIGVWRDDDGVPAELALDHPYGGLTATLLRPADGITGEQVRAAMADAELALGFSPIPLPASAPVTQQGHHRLGGCVMTLSFSEASPVDSWDAQRALAARLSSDGLGEVLWSAPFIPTIPGTDTYTDQLW